MNSMKMKLVRERLDFDREGEPLHKMGVGVKRPGQPKDFNDVKIGDKTIDYNDEEGTVVDFARYADDPKKTKRLAADFWDDVKDMYGDDLDSLEVIEVEGPDYGHMGGHGSVTFIYEPDGAVAVW